VKPTSEILAEISLCSKDIRNYFEALHLENEKLTTENAELLARVNQNTTNSSKPPSSSPFIKPKSLREKTGRKPGGQPGHKGSTLRLEGTPDVIIEHRVDICCHCGEDISEDPVVREQIRQKVDVRIVKETTEHRCQVKNCHNCGKDTVGEFPQGVDHYIQYGENFSAIVVCLGKGNYVPYDRLSKISEDILGVSVSSGTLVNIVHNFGRSLEGSMEYIKEQLKQADVVHFDETGTRVKGKNKWLHSAGNKRFTYMRTHAKRGSDATEEIGILPVFRGTAIHDFWKSYYKYCCCRHALCNAHILRELTGITENFNQIWSDQMKALLVEIKKRVEVAEGELNSTEIEAFEDRYFSILSLADEENPINIEKLTMKNKRGRTARSKARNLLDRMKLYKQDILKFMVEPDIPFDNNLAERDLRMSKLQQKVSGGFRSDEGNEAFDNIRSYISTANKQGKSIFNAIREAISGNPLFTYKNH
jgi:transposase